MKLEHFIAIERSKLERVLIGENVPKDNNSLSRRMPL